MFIRSVKVPLILQMEEMEGAAACLDMILSYYKKQLSLEEVREACGISRDGIHIPDIIRAGEEFGLIVKESRTTAKELKESCHLPAILSWEREQFVVFEGFRSGKACLAHPAKGRMSMALAELEKKYTGTALEFRPGSSFVADGRRTGTAAFLWDVMITDRTVLMLVLLTGLLAAAGGILTPVFSRIFIDDILNGERLSWYPGILYSFAAVIFLQLLSMLIHRVIIIRSTGRMAVKSNYAYMSHLLALPLVFFQRRRTGDLANRQNANDMIAETLIGELAPMLMNVLMLVFYIMIMARYSLLLTGIGLVSIILNLLLVRRVGIIRREISSGQYRSQANLDSVTVTGIDMIETIKATGSESGYFERWSGFHASVLKAATDFNEKARFLLQLPSFIQKLSDQLIFFTGCWLIIEGHFSAGLLLAFMQFLQSVASPVDALLEAGGNLQAMGSSLERVNDVMDHEKEVDFSEDYEGVDFENVQKLSGNVELKAVSFGYSRYAEPLIRDFSLSLKPGKKVALVGGSGSGKSTIVKMIAGLNKPWSGEILFDGKRIDEIPRSLFKSSLAMVNQEIAIFHDSMENNIRLWDDSIKDYELKLAARDAGLHDFIMSTKDNYQMILEENGKNLSGGERQRVEIARVLALDPSILIMDEATSALDARTEYEISEYVRSRGITCIIVAHRLSTIRDCDEIIVMDEGRVVERGNHDSLMASDGLYKKLIMNS